MKVLLLHPDFKEHGGVGQYYGKLKDKFSVPVQHCIIGKRPGEKGLWSRIYRSLSDYFRFLRSLGNNQFEIVHANPSLDPKSLLRDGIFLLSARMMKRKTILFIRGWNKLFESKLERRGLWMFKLFYGKINAFIVLSKEFKEKLESWGFKQPIHLEVTIADDNALEGFDVHQTLNDRMKSKNWRVLFISRIFKSKGIYETIKAVSILRTKYPEIELVVAGEGDELENVRSYVRDLSLSNVLFTGFIRGEEKKNVLKRAHILSFPTNYGEGLPNTIIESMAYGLPVVTRMVGGIADFFENEAHGFATTSKDPEVLAGFMERLFQDQELYKKISLFNYNYAQSTFMASQAAARLEKIYKSL